MASIMNENIKAKHSYKCLDGKVHWWVRSGLGLRCKLCNKRKK